MSDPSGGYSDSPDSPYNGRIIHGTAPSAFTQRQPGGALYKEPAQKTEDGKSEAEFNLGAKRAPSASTVGTPSRVTPVASDAARKVPAAYVKKSK